MPFIERYVTLCTIGRAQTSTMIRSRCVLTAVSTHTKGADIKINLAINILGHTFVIGLGAEMQKDVPETEHTHLESTVSSPMGFMRNDDEEDTE